MSIRNDKANPRYHDPKMLALAERIGDLRAAENERVKYDRREDMDWDTYTWLGAYPLLENQLGAERRERWKKALPENTAPAFRAGRSRCKRGLTVELGIRRRTCSRQVWQLIL